MSTATKQLKRPVDDPGARAKAISTATKAAAPKAGAPKGAAAAAPHDRSDRRLTPVAPRLPDYRCATRFEFDT